MSIQERDIEAREAAESPMTTRDPSSERIQDQSPSVTPPPFSPRAQRAANDLLSPLGVLFIAILIMTTIVAFSLGLGMNTSKGSNSNATADSSMPGMSTNSSTDESGIPQATYTQGGVPATYTRDSDGAKHFHLTAETVMWTPTKGAVPQKAYTINGMVPAPTIHVTAGDHIRVTLHNMMSQATALHWHGLHVSMPEDGVVGLGMPKPITQHQSYTYDFTIPDEDAGTHWYHSHYNDNDQVPGGMYGALIIDPRPGTPEMKQAIHADVEYTQIISEMGAYYIINGKAFPDTQVIHLKHGQTVHLRIIGAGEMMHPMHLHGHSFTIMAEDGHMLPQPVEKDTIQVAPGETYDVIFQGTGAPGSIYPFHCHILAHLMNPGQTQDQMGGLITLVQYDK